MCRRRIIFGNEDIEHAQEDNTNNTLSRISTTDTHTVHLMNQNHHTQHMHSALPECD